MDLVFSSVVLTLLVLLQVIDVHVNNNSMDTLTVTNPSDSIYNAEYADISGCRHSGQKTAAAKCLTAISECIFSENKQLISTFNLHLQVWFINPAQC